MQQAAAETEGLLNKPLRLEAIVKQIAQLTRAMESDVDEA